MVLVRRLYGGFWVYLFSGTHLVLMDIGLPLFNGYHWCQEIRKISRSPSYFCLRRTGLWILSWQSYGGGWLCDSNTLTSRFFWPRFRACLIVPMVWAWREFAGICRCYPQCKSMDLHYQGQVFDFDRTKFQILRVLFDMQAMLARDDLMQELWNSDFLLMIIRSLSMWLDCVKSWKSRAW